MKKRDHRKVKEGKRVSGVLNNFNKRGQFCLRDTNPRLPSLYWVFTNNLVYNVLTLFSHWGEKQ